MIETGDRARVVTPDMAEEALMEALACLAVLPDRERGWLAGGKGLRLSAWPDILRQQTAGDYPGDAAPRRRLSRRDMAQLDRTLLGERAAVLAVPDGQRSLLGRVLAMKLWPRAGGFQWADVWLAEGGRRCGVTSDALRMRYERALARVARRLNALGGL